MSTPYEELLPGTQRALLHRIAVGQAGGRTPSLVGAVMREGRMVWSGGRSMIVRHGPDADTQYRIGSLTKTFVAVLVMRLRDEGRLDLADPVRKHLDSEAGAEGIGDPTIAQLLSHTAGLAAEARGPWWERTPGGLRPELADVLGERPVRHPAGRTHHYSNPGYALLGALVERLRGEPWSEVLRREVLEPLGMARTTLLPQSPHAGGFAVHPWADVMLPEPAEDTGRMAPAGQLWSTAADLCRWTAFLAGGDERVLAAGSVAEMRVPATEPQGPDWDGGYGLGMQLMRKDGRLFAGHTGSMPGFLAALWVSEADAVGGVVLSNCTSGPAVATIAADLAAIVADNEPRMPEPWKPLPQADPELLELTGPWYWGPAPFALRLLADRALQLAPLSGAGRGSRFRPEEDGSWTGLDGYYAGETLRLGRRAADGVVDHLDLGTFVFTRQPYEQAAPVPGGVDPGGWQAG
ncbi:serine hydrolase domain-containing protein [Streptomyces sp. H27-D2]|uniref:serine hydrolase domain-containing protein n=1 Tax=Streptomyces sp. H27-D2 TaxID=3046304 RepID=UPI002DBD6BA8|nr:serine hydrolase domain-containing protein [Streptomyces sp. H27-D2]MEC4015770.1 serine hydrolase domain-containing protein [Streptomyces sp. H27-D2]